MVSPEFENNEQVEKERIDINTCTKEDLVKLKGIGPETADNIIFGRPYGKVDDLDRVEDIGPKTLEEIRPFLTVSLIEHVNIPNLVSPREGATEPEQDRSDVGVNVNTCTLEELLSVPKVGARLVARIIDGRPYGRMKDLLRVDGISESKLEVIRPYLTAGPDKAWRSVDEPPPSKPKKPKKAQPKQTEPEKSKPAPAKDQAQTTEPAETKTTAEPALPAIAAATTTAAATAKKDHEAPPVEPSEDTQDSERQTIIVDKRYSPSKASVWLMGLVAVIAAILLTLGIIWMINGGLRHVTLDDLNQRIETLDDETDIQSSDLETLETANADLEERVAALEETLATTNEELAEATDLAESLSALVEKDVDLQEQIDALEERVSALEEKVLDLEEQIFALQTAGGTFEAPSPNE